MSDDHDYSGEQDSPHRDVPTSSEHDIPLVRRVIPVAPPFESIRPESEIELGAESVLAPAAKPQPGFLMGLLLTLAFMVTLYGSIIAAFIVALVGYGVALGFDAVKPGPVPAGKEMDISVLPDAIQASLALASMAGYVVALLFALGMGRLMVGQNWTRMVGLQRLPITHWLLAVLILPSFMIISNTLGELIFDALGSKPPEMGFQSMFKWFHWSFAVLAIGVGPGIVEEIWCRGLLSRGFLGRYGWFGGILLTSLFFGAMHAYPLAFVLITAIMGLGLHVMYVLSRSLWVPMTVHFMNNSLSVLGEMKTINLQGVEAAANNQFSLVLLLAVGATMFGLLGMWSARGRLVDSAGVPCVHPDRGMIVPPRETGILVVHSPPNPIWVSFAIIFAGALMYLLLS